MPVRIILEVNEHRQVFSFDGLGNSILGALRTVVRQEVERVLASRTIPQGTKDPEPNRPLALSKAKAAQALGVSVRTIDNCIAQKGIRVMRIGRRVLVPMHSIEAALKHGALETHSDDPILSK
jgi:excisionase family DNA binding protein